MDFIDIRRIVAVLSIFSLATTPLGISPVYGESIQSTSQTIETISPLSQKEIFVLPQTDVLGLEQIFHSLSVEVPVESKKDDKNEDIQECRVEVSKKQITPCIKKEKEHIVTKELTITATAYSSTMAQTDNSPCTTANGYNVCKANKENVVAANFLPFGTKVKFPEVYGDKIFTVQDRMNRRFNKRIDFWMKTTNKARQFGVKQVKVQVVEELLAQNF